MQQRGQKAVAKSLRVAFTDKFLCNAKPAPGKASTRYSDTECLGLGIRVGKRAKVFLFATVDSRRYLIGPYPQWTLFEARQRCEEIRRADDPASVTKQVTTVRQAFERFAETGWRSAGPRLPSSTGGRWNSTCSPNGALWP